jgi:hypothetical protein
LTVEEIPIFVGDQCGSAIVAPTDGTSVLGITTVNIEGLSTNKSLGSKPGAWYEVVGTGLNLTASTCHESTKNATQQVTVFTGDCDLLKPIDSTITPCGLQASATWESVSGQKYFVSVQANEDDASLTDDSFVLSVEETTPNDLCESAIGALFPDGSRTFGSTRSATVDDADLCDESNPTGRGVWYTAFGTGDMFSASVCSEFTTFVAQVSVFVGGCEDLQCVEGSNDSICGSGDESIFRWSSVAGIFYHILVSGVGSDEYGNFVLTID